jgi:polysaccharide chain length determinant protein (PEP-CTERM system associated)
MDYVEINRYLDIARRRKYWFIIPFLAVLLGGMGYLLNAPKLFEAKTLILVQTQSVPKEYVRSVVTEGVDERLKTITQQVTSRTNLEAIVRECGLYGTGGIDESIDLDELVGEVRQRITISMGTGEDQGRKRGSAPKTLEGATAFTISFLGESPEKAVQVTNALASKYISENSEFREAQVKGTTAFLGDELESTKKRLNDKEQELKAYRERFMGGLPEQLNPNLAMIQRLQSRADQLSRDLSDLENRKFVVQQNLEEMRTAGRTVTSFTGKNYEVKDLAFLKSELIDLQTRYTDNHPDVVRLKKVIETLETLEPEKRTASTTKLAGLPKGEQALVQQLDVIDLDIAKTKTEMRLNQGEISAYQKRIDDTPKREQELLLMQRDYKNSKDQYDSLEKRKLEADLALNMEIKQKSEQFRILDPAKLTTSYPVAPNVKKVLLMILVLGIGLSGGLAYFRETIDTSFKTPEEAEKELDMKILVSTPFRHTKQELRGRKIKEAAFASSVAAGFVVFAAAIVLFTGGVDDTLTSLKMLLGMR